MVQGNPQHPTTARTVTFDRLASGRLGEQTELTEVEVSVEDLAILAQDPDYSSFPNDDNLNFEYFEQTVQNDKNDEPVIHQVPEKVKLKRVCELESILLRVDTKLFT